MRLMAPDLSVQSVFQFEIILCVGLQDSQDQL
jgi:hypothetical protein